jgi:AraC family transcriptional regulator
MTSTFALPAMRSLSEKKLVGKKLSMSYAENKTGELWKSFMPVRKEIRNVVSSDLFSMQIYSSSFDFTNFNPHMPFEKWAAVEVADFENVPPDMDAFTLPSGLYAVFFYKGPISGGPQMFRYIFQDWLPGSEYVLDQRPHFELLGEKYKNGSPDSEEEFWIPVRRKAN